MQRGILEQMKEAEPIHKKHYMQSSKDKSVSAGMVFKKNSIDRKKAKASTSTPPLHSIPIHGRKQKNTTPKT